MNIILLILIAGSLIGIGVIVIRKLPQLSIVEVESVKEKREARIKQDILINRLKRLRAEGLIKLVKTIMPVVAPWGKKIKDNFLKIYQKILDLERKYKKGKSVVKEEAPSEVDDILAEAENLKRQENLKEAENLYLEAIKLDYKNVSSYEGLGDLYLKRREYKEAKEIFEHILKLEPERPDIFLVLAESFVGLGDGEGAIESLEKALEIEPNNPKYLDFLIEIGIMSKNYRISKNALERLKEVNPENQKIKDFEVRVKGISRRV